jgi:hypothetical protein
VTTVAFALVMDDAGEHSLLILLPSGICFSVVGCQVLVGRHNVGGIGSPAAATGGSCNGASKDPEQHVFLYKLAKGHVSHTYGVSQ